MKDWWFEFWQQDVSCCARKLSPLFGSQEGSPGGPLALKKTIQLHWLFVCLVWRPASRSASSGRLLTAPSLSPRLVILRLA